MADGTFIEVVTNPDGSSVQQVERQGVMVRNETKVEGTFITSTIQADGSKVEIT